MFAICAVSRIFCSTSDFLAANRLYKRFRDKEVQLKPRTLAYDLANVLRCIEQLEAMTDWSLTSLRLKLITIEARILLHSGRGCRNRPDGARHFFGAIHLIPIATIVRARSVPSLTQSARHNRFVDGAEKVVTPRHHGPRDHGRNTRIDPTGSG